MRLSVRSIRSLVRIASIAMFSSALISAAVPFSALQFVTPASAQVGSISVEFRTALEPYGSFRNVARWGEVWVPNDVATDWRPYTVGHWVYSDDYGWYWISDAAEAPWGWVVFHYGRWVRIDDIGWAWVSGREWGPAWVDWRRGDRYVGWAPLPPDELVVEIRDEPQYWIFCRPHDFLATNVATVFIEPEPVILRETVVVNETVVVHDRGFAVNPGIEPAVIATSIGRPIPEYDVRPRVLAGTASLPNAIEVRGEDLRRTDFRQSLVRQTDIRETNSRIRPTANVPRPQPLAPNEHGRMGQNPPRAASDFAQQPQQPSSIGRGPEQERGLREGGAMGATPEQQRGLSERGANSGQERRLYNRGETGVPPREQRGPTERDRLGATPEQQRNFNERGATRPTPEQQQRGSNGRGGMPEQQRGLTERGANEGQGRRLYNRGDTGLPPGEQRGPTERNRLGATPEQQRNFNERGATGPTPEQQQRGINQRGAIPQQQRGLPERGANTGQERRLYNRGETGLPSEQQRGSRDRGPLGAAPEQQRHLPERGSGGSAIEQQRRFGRESGGLAPRESGGTGPSPAQERQLFNRAPSGPAPGPQRGAGERGPNGPGPGLGGGQRRGFER